MNGETKYLTYTPWPGQLNNTRMCFETALVLAYVTGRCLVMPKEYRRQHEPEVEAGRFRPLHPEECFQLETLGGIVPLVEREEYDRGVGSDRCADVVLKPGTTVFCFPAAPPPGSAEAHRMGDFAASRQCILEMTREMEACRTLNIESPTLEHFYTFFYFLQPDVELACKRLVREHVRFRTAIVSAAERIAAALGNYCALHVRRNDFLRQYPEQNIPVHRILGSLRKRVPAGKRLYIATDETDERFFADLRDDYETCFLKDFAGLLPENLPAESLACVEQVVCALASLFMGTRLSTFSGYITRLRGYYGAVDKNTYFTDGSPGSEMDDRGSPRFSWTNWVRCGNPLWGREFREAWEF